MPYYLYMRAAGGTETRLDVNFQEVVHSIRTGNVDVAKPQRFAEDRMDTHKNARLTPKGREEMVRAVVDRGMTKAAAARQFNTTPKTVGKWVDRFLAEGVGGLRDRSSRPLSSPVQIPPATCDAVESLRRERHTQGAHRNRARYLQSQCLAHSRTPRPQPALQPRAAESPPTLRAREARRNHPSRHQKTRPLPQCWPSRHWTPHRLLQQSRRRLGIRPRRH